MRIGIVISLLLAVLLIGGLLLLPRLVTWNDYRDEVIAQAEAITGQSVAVEGRVDLELLPQPTLTLAQATLSARAAAAAGQALVVDRLDLRLKALPLLGGQIEVEEVRLVRPVLELERAAPPEDIAAALARASGSLMLPVAAGAPSRLSVVDGRAMVNGGATPVIEAVNLDVTAAGPQGPYALDGSFAIAGRPFAFSAQLGQLAPEAWSTLQLELSTPMAGGEPTSLSFRGLAWSDPDTPRLRGSLSVKGSDARAAFDAFGRALDHGVALPRWLAAPFRLAGRLEFGEKTASLDDLSLTLAGTEAAGKLHLDVGPRPTIDLELGLPRLAVPEAWPLTDAGGSLAALAALSDGLSGQVDLAVQTLEYRGGTIRRLRTRVALSGTGAVAVEEARAILPGQTTLGFTGALAGPGEDTPLEGSLTLVTSDLRALLGWLDIAPSELPEGRLRSLSLASRLALSEGTLRFADGELRVDASRVAGSLAVSFEPRLQIAGALTLDRLDLDAYWPDGEVRTLASAGLEAFASIDAAVDARIERLTWRGLRLEDVVLDGRSVAGHLTLNELSLREATDSKARLVGEFDLEHQAFDLTAGLETARPAQLLRRLGMAPPLMLARLTSVAVEGSARGDLEAFDLELALHHESARLDLKGPVEWTDEGPRYDLAIDASHPDYPALLDQLGAPRPPGAEAAQAFTMTGKVTGDLAAEEVAVVGSARLGAMSLTGRADWAGARPRPRLSARISAGEPQLEALAGLAALAGLQLDPSLMIGPRAGAWSDQPLGLRWLAGFDAEVELSAKGGAVGSGLEASIRLDRGRLLVDRLSAAPWHGQLEAQASFDIARRLPFLSIALDFRAIDPTALAAWLDLPPVLTGPGDLYVEATSAGGSARDLVRGLIGDVKVALPDGRLIGEELVPLRLTPLPAAAAAPGLDDGTDEDGQAVPIANLTGSFSLKQGIARTAGVPFLLDGREARLEGSIDLLLWAADLTLRLDPGGPGDDALGLRLVGPLERPQIRPLERSEPLPAQAPVGDQAGPSIFSGRTSWSNSSAVSNSSASAASFSDVPSA